MRLSCGCRSHDQVAVEQLAALPLELQSHAFEPGHLLFEPLSLVEAGLTQHISTQFSAFQAKRELRKLR